MEVRAYFKLMDGMRLHYGIAPKHLRFFSVRYAADKDHSEAGHELIDRFVTGTGREEEFLAEARCLARFFWEGVRLDAGGLRHLGFHSSRHRNSPEERPEQDRVQGPCAKIEEEAEKRFRQLVKIARRQTIGVIYLDRLRQAASGPARRKPMVQFKSIW
jgi:hypothetical protein